MVHFMHLDLISATMSDNQPNLIILDIEFTHPSQTDGHSPSHGDDARCFVEAIIRNLPREKIVALFKEHNIKGLRIDDQITGCRVWEKNVLHPDYYMPLLKMELRVSLRLEEDTHLSLVNQVMDNVSWQAMKYAVAFPNKYYWYTRVCGLGPKGEN